MASHNLVVLVGNVGRNVDVRYLPSGDPVANFSLATTETWRDKQGMKKEDTQWHQVEVFGKPAEVARDYITKGKPVLVQGSIRYDSWVDKDGVKREKAKIKVSGPGSRLVLLGSRGDAKPATDQGADVIDDGEGPVPF